MSKSQEPTPPKVFISYAWKNQSLAKQLQRDLQRDGVEIFVDYEKIKGGDSLPARISKALEWCNTLLLLWSSEAAESDWVAQEWENALQLKKRIIPCMLDGAELPALLRRLLYIDFSSYDAGYIQLCRALGVEPKVGSEKVIQPEQPQQAGQQESLPPSTKKTKSIAETLAAIKPKLKRPLGNKSTITTVTRSSPKPKTPIWRRHGLMMNITFVIIVVALAVALYRWSCDRATPDSGKKNPVAQKSSPPDSTRDTTANLLPSKPKSRDPEVTAEQGSKANVERKRTGETVTPIRQSIPNFTAAKGKQASFRK